MSKKVLILSGSPRTSSRCIVVIQLAPVDRLFNKSSTSGPLDSDTSVQSLLCRNPALIICDYENFSSTKNSAHFFPGLILR